MRTPLVVAVLGVVVGCFSPSNEHVVGSVHDAGVRCAKQRGFGDQEVCATIPERVVCGGNPCAAGEECCQTTATCITPGAGACPSASGTCSAQSDCAADEFCMLDDVSRCTGPGHCRKFTDCGWCSPVGTERCIVCGCNGLTYASMQEACVAGVNVALSRFSAERACGIPSVPGMSSTISCGSSAQCPSGAQCCAHTGRCYDTSEPWRCQNQPEGTLLDCTNDTECGSTNGAGGGTGAASEPWCERVSGCGGPGHCRNRTSASDCGGAVAQVCGCDGTTYTNECWARVAGVNVSHQGPCP